MSAKQPVMFIGHGSPMNAIEDNSYTQMLHKLGKELDKPKAILCVSAHWMTKGSVLTQAQRPRIIYDMYGFPEALYQVKYPAPGDPILAQQIQKLVPDAEIALDQGSWGLDHGTWSVLVHLFPEAKIPVLQLSIDMEKDFAFHFELGKKLQVLRSMGVLILGSGNIVHNLRRISWEENAPAMPWAKEYSDWFRAELATQDYANLIYHARESEAGKLSIPTTEHYIPCLYVLGASGDETPRIEFEGIQNGSLDMVSFSFGRN